MTGGEVVRAALAASVTRLREHEAGARDGDDPEDVHQARVATRRLRSDLRTFRPLLDRAWADSLRRELRWLADALGAVRDIEVLCDRIRRTAARPETDPQVAARLVERLAARRDDARRRLSDEMASVRYLALVDRLSDAAEVVAFSPDASRPAEVVLPPLVRSRWRRLERAVRRARAERTDATRPSDEELHHIRILAKRCRYAAEAVEPAVGKDARRFARRVADLQDVLGEQHDAVVAAAWLTDVAQYASSEEVMLAGKLATLEQFEGFAARQRFPRVWHRADRKKLRAWFT